MVAERAPNAHGYRNWVTDQPEDQLTGQSTHLLADHGRSETADMDVTCSTRSGLIPLDSQGVIESCNKVSTVCARVRIETCEENITS